MDVYAKNYDSVAYSKINRKAITFDLSGGWKTATFR